MTKDLWYIVRIPTRTSNFKTMTNLFNLRFDRARANGNTLCLQITIIDNSMGNDSVVVVSYVAYLV